MCIKPWGEEGEVVEEEEEEEEVVVEEEEQEELLRGLVGGRGAR